MTLNKKWTLQEVVGEIRKWSFKLELGKGAVTPKSDLAQKNFFSHEIDVHPEYIESQRVFGALDELLSNTCQQKQYERHGYLFLLDIPGSGFLISKFKEGFRRLNYFHQKGRQGSLIKCSRKFYLGHY